MFKTNQIFNETPNGIITNFTTPEHFVEGTMFVTQGEHLVFAWTYVDNEEIQFTTAPILADGILKWAAETELGDPLEDTHFPTPGATEFWTIQNLLLWYPYTEAQFPMSFVNTTDFQNFIGNVIVEVETAIENYLGATLWAEAIANKTAELGLMVKQAVAMRMKQLFSQQYGATIAVSSSQTATKREVQFEGAGQITETYSAPATSTQSSLTESSILGMSDIDLYDYYLGKFMGDTSIIVGQAMEKEDETSLWPYYTDESMLFNL